MRKIQQRALPLPWDKEATFENFWTGPKGEGLQVVSHIKELAEGDDKEHLVSVWGGAGCGKSHLLQAACHWAFQHRRWAIYLPLKEPGMTPDILDDLEAVDLVCIDDIECVLGSARWEEALFHFYNRSLHAKTRWLVSSDRPPRVSGARLQDLQSRLSSGLIFALALFTDEEKGDLLRWRARLRGMLLSEEVVAFLMRHWARDLPSLMERLDLLDRASLQAQRRITIPFIKQVLCLE